MSGSWSAGRRTPGASTPGSSRTFFTWIVENADLVDALTTLRDLGDEGADAANAICQMPRFMKMQFSVDLWTLMCECEGTDAYEVLRAQIPSQMLRMLRWGVWGSPWPGRACAINPRRVNLR